MSLAHDHDLEHQQLFGCRVGLRWANLIGNHFKRQQRKVAKDGKVSAEDNEEHSGEGGEDDDEDTDECESKDEEEAEVVASAASSQTEAVQA